MKNKYFVSFLFKVVNGTSFGSGSMDITSCGIRSYEDIKELEGLVKKAITEDPLYRINSVDPLGVEQVTILNWRSYDND